MNKTIMTLLLLLFASAVTFAQEKKSALKVSGYVQAQLEHGARYATTKVGAPNSMNDSSVSRIGIRRGFIKLTYTHGASQVVLQSDLTERGIALKDAYYQLGALWGASSLKVGIFDRPFGQEISYSSSLRESPERSRIFPTLFPDERDLGAMVTLQADKQSPWHFIKLETGLFAGNGIKPESDNRRDLITHLSLKKEFGGVTLTGGASYYHGFVRQGSDELYQADATTGAYKQLTGNKGAYVLRRYWGGDLQVALKTSLGATRLVAEILGGTQPGRAKSNKSPNSATVDTTPIYMRPFSGGYAMLVQQIGALPLSAVVKYEWYDPNTAFAPDKVTMDADLAMSAVGAGLLWQLSNNVRLQAYYEHMRTETTSKVQGYESDRPDDLLTLRLQYKF